MIFNRSKSALLVLCGLFLFSCSETGGEQIELTDKTTEQSTEASRITKLPSRDAQQGLHDNVHCALKASSGDLWFGTTGHGVFRFDGQDFTRYTAADGLNHNDIWSLTEDAQGNIIMATSAGVARFDGKNFDNFSSGTPFESAAITEVETDSRGNVWVATLENGTYWHDGTAFHNVLADSIQNENGLTMNSINGIHEDREGQMWFTSWAFACEGVSRFDGKSIMQFTEREGIKDSLVHCVIQDRTGQIWVGSRDHGPYHFDGQAFSHFQNDSIPETACIYEMLEDSRGNIWFATERNGVYCFDGQNTTHFTTENGLINNSVFSMLEDYNGNIWFGTRDLGLCKYDGLEFVDYSE